MQDWHAVLLERASVDKFTGIPDPHWTRYNISFVPADVGAEGEAQGIESWRLLASQQAEPLRTLLLEYCKTWDYGLAIKSGENGRRIKSMETEQMLDKMNQRQLSPEQQTDAAMNYQEARRRDPYSGDKMD